MKILAVPHHKQKKNDYACGPVCIGMAIDYLRKRHHKPPLNFQESLDIAARTMHGNLRRKSGTFTDDMIRAIRGLDYKVKTLSGDKEQRLDQIREAINNRQPVILYCVISIERRPYKHFIVVTGIDDNYLYFNDPYPRRLKKTRLTAFCANSERLRWIRSRWGIVVSLK